MAKYKLGCRVLLGFAALILLLTLAFPIWSYYITAPQYPEGLHLHIYANKLAGDIDNLNILNHYVGMKPIHPDSFPELKIIPFVIILLSIFGILASVIGNRLLSIVWFVVFGVLGIMGFGDFYRWLYHYGHNLNPEAPLKLGTDYMPPIIGIKKMLNITVYAHPHIGGIVVFLSALLGLMGIISCSPKPQKINYGKDACNYCKMIISDRRFGGEIVLKTGKVYKFDDIGCLINFFWEQNLTEKDVAMFLVVDYKTGELIDATKSFYIQSDKIHSPMAYDIAAFKNPEDAEEFLNEKGGGLMNWAQVNELVRRQGRVR